MINPDRGRKRVRRRILVWARWGLGLGLAALAVYVLLGRRGELSGTATSFRHIDPLWLLPAVVLEIISIVCFAETITRLLTETDHPLRLRSLVWITVASNSVANSLPAGPAFGAAYSYRQMTLRGVPSILAAWAMLASGILATAGLAMLATVGVVGAFGQSSGVRPDRGDARRAGHCRPARAHPEASPDAHRFRAPRHGRGSLAAAQTALGPGGCGHPVPGAVGAVTPGWPGLVVALAWAVGNWVFDLGCLLCAFGAVGSPIPWRGVVLAYGAAQLAANLPITPGGLGVVEGSLTIGLVAYGGAEASSVAVVLIYRALSFWMPLLVGWAAAGVLAVERKRIERAEPVATGRLEEVAG